MERMKEQVSEIFAMLESKLAVTEREFKEINTRYNEIVTAREKAYQRWQEAQRAFECIDALQGMINEEGETSDE